MNRALVAVVLAALTAGCGGSDHTGHGGVVDSFDSIPNPAILVANGGDGTISVLDPVTLRVASSVSVADGAHPHHIGLSPDGTRVLVTAMSTDLSGGHSHMGHDAAANTKVYEIDVASRELREVIDVNAMAHNAAFTRDGATIVLGMMEHGMIAGYDASTFVQSFTAGGFNMPLEVTPTGSDSLLVAESGADRVALFDLASRTTVARFDVGAAPVAAWSSGGGDYFVSAEEGMRLDHLVEGESGVTADGHPIELGGMPGQAVETPDGSELWVAIEDLGVVAVLDASTHEKLAEFAAGTKPHGIAFEPNGSRAFITDEDGGKILVVDVAERLVTSEVAVGGAPNGIAWLQH